MKTRIILSLILAVLFSSLGNAKKVTISNSGNTYTPDEITVELGDTVVFNISSYHNAVEVSQSTWDANGTEPNGGFDIDFGGGELVLETPGTFYYVCTPHASLGMKGIITVTSTITSSEQSTVESNSDAVLSVYPNPVSDLMTLSFNVNRQTRVSINILDITGRTTQNLIDSDYEPGIYTEIVNLEHLRAGRYFVYYRSRYESTVWPLLLVK
ncbi:MAG: hypothetical protein JSV22_00290 [Bacteroidales bacterium]|nr:MAG: hypothetical protein JSV22_00290 [Bacteroidales bacterium]